MNQKLEDLKKKFNDHFDREIELIDEMHKAELSAKEYTELSDSMLSHKHAKSLLLIENDELERIKNKVKEIEEAEPSSKAE